LDVTIEILPGCIFPWQMRNTQSEKEVNKKRVQIQINFSIGYICTRGIVCCCFFSSCETSLDYNSEYQLWMWRHQCAIAEHVSYFLFHFSAKTGKCYDIFSLWLNWLKTRGGNSPFSPQPPYHATNRSLGKNCIDLSLLLASLSIFSPNRM
jgi:hypothetical protein